MTEIVTVTLNPALDISTSVERVEPVRKLRCGDARRDPGGGGINVARVVKRLGGDVLAVYPVGGPLGQMLHAKLRAEELPSLCAPIAGDTRESFTVVETATGREFRFILPGPRLSKPEWAACLEAAAGQNARFLVASGGLPPGAPEGSYAQLARRAKETGALMVLDCAGPALKAALDEGVYLAKPNLRELQELTGKTLGSDAEKLAAARAIIAQGGAAVIALTLGDQGAMLVTNEAAWRAQPLPIQPKSSVGAGDSFLGGMVWALASGLSLEDAFRHGMAAGSAALLSSGTELCHPDDLRRLLPLVAVNAI